MSPLVVFFVTVCNESFSTEAADKRPLAGVRLDVVYKTGGMLKHFQAIFVRTLIFQSTTNHDHVFGVIIWAALVFI